MKRISPITRTFGTLSSLFVLDEIKLRENIILVHNEKTTSDKVEIATTLNSFFSNIIKNLKILKYYVQDEFPLSFLRHSTLETYLIIRTI